VMQEPGTMISRWIPMTCLLLLMASCTTKMGTMIATDRIVSPNDHIEPLGSVSASVTRDGLLWARPANRDLYDEVRNNALALRDGNLLINAKVTTVLTSYLGVYYRTMVHIDGTAARVAGDRPHTPAGIVTPPAEPGP
jgi:hypothetical protein